MLSKEQNEFVTQTGPGTPMGELFRRYWIPALLAEELPENDCAPVRVKLLSERLVAIRDTQGKTGLIDEFCPHRGASLWFGRVEECGVRCPYHGWKFGVDGQCIDVPSEPEESGFRAKIKLKNYPLVLRGGVYWTYMGPLEDQPPLPEWEFAMVPEGHAFISKRLQECNYLQAMEGGIDSSHVSFLHSGDLNRDPLFKGAAGNEHQLDYKVFFEVVDHANGLYIGARRNAAHDKYYWRITPWVMPSFTMVAPRGDHPVHGHFWIPNDDENCTAWSYDYKPERKLYPAEIAAMKDGKGVHAKTIPGTYRPVANKDNDYLMDRDAQRAGLTYSGIEGIAIQDGSLQESMGPVVDRTKENLTTCDNGIIMARLKLIRAAKALRDKGTLPPGRLPEAQHVRSAAILLDPTTHFAQDAETHFKARTLEPHSSV
ncbi:MAG: Rieske 2Fe-2S domain-containing protein [Acidocella sp.]|nr:Rieske 2Fe-2S domain-containing protein [Acidocella sp.]